MKDADNKLIEPKENTYYVMVGELVTIMANFSKHQTNIDWSVDPDFGRLIQISQNTGQYMASTPGGGWVKITIWNKEMQLEKKINFVAIP